MSPYPFSSSNTICINIKVFKTTMFDPLSATLTSPPHHPCSQRTPPQPLIKRSRNRSPFVLQTLFSSCLINLQAGLLRHTSLVITTEGWKLQSVQNAASYFTSWYEACQCFQHSTACFRTQFKRLAWPFRPSIAMNSSDPGYFEGLWLHHRRPTLFLST